LLHFHPQPLCWANDLVCCLPDSDPSGERLSTHPNHIDTFLDYISEADTIAPSRLNVSNRASRWSVEALRGQRLVRGLSPEPEWKPNRGFEGHQYAAPWGASTSTAFSSLPNIAPEAGRSQWGEERQEYGDPPATAISSSSSGSAGVLTELGELSRISGDPRMMRSFSPPHHHDEHDALFPPTSPSRRVVQVEPPTYDEATDHLAAWYDHQGDRGYFGEPHLHHPHHIAYDVHPHLRTHHPARPLPALPNRERERRHDGPTSPLESELVHLNRTRSRGVPSPLSPPLSHHQHSMKHPAVLPAAASEYTKEARPASRLSITRYPTTTGHNQDRVLSEPFHAGEHHHPDDRYAVEEAEEGLEENDYLTYRQPPGTGMYRPRSRSGSGTLTVDAAAADTSRAPVVIASASAPSSMQGDPEEYMIDVEPGETQTQTQLKPRLSKIERALLRRALGGLKAESPQQLQLERS
jgi:hypothetical protein